MYNSVLLAYGDFICLQNKYELQASYKHWFISQTNSKTDMIQLPMLAILSSSLECFCYGNIYAELLSGKITIISFLDVKKQQIRLIFFRKCHPIRSVLSLKRGSKSSSPRLQFKSGDRWSMKTWAKPLWMQGTHTATRSSCWGNFSPVTLMRRCIQGTLLLQIHAVDKHLFLLRHYQLSPELNFRHSTL